MKKSGFTLVELLVGMFLLALLMTAVLVLFLPHVRLSSITRQISEAQQDALMGHTGLLHELAQSDLYMTLNYTDPSLPMPSGVAGAVAFPVAYDEQNFHFILGAPHVDPMTGFAIQEGFPNWRAIVVYYADSTGALWRVRWPVCSSGASCQGFASCPLPESAVTRVACGDLNTTVNVTDASHPRLKGSAIGNYAISTGLPGGVTARALGQGVTGIRVLSSDTSPLSQTPARNPARLILLVRRHFGQYSPTNPPAFFPISPGVTAGDSIMTLDSSVVLMTRNYF